MVIQSKVQVVLVLELYPANSPNGREYRVFFSSMIGKPSEAKLKVGRLN